jgi:hypothetical protein
VTDCFAGCAKGRSEARRFDGICAGWIDFSENSDDEGDNTALLHALAEIHAKLAGLRSSIAVGSNGLTISGYSVAWFGTCLALIWVCIFQGDDFAHGRHIDKCDMALEQRTPIREEGLQYGVWGLTSRARLCAAVDMIAFGRCAGRSRNGSGSSLGMAVSVVSRCVRGVGCANLVDVTHSKGLIRR